jgi:hypothetical protein
MGRAAADPDGRIGRAQFLDTGGEFRASSVMATARIIGIMRGLRPATGSAAEERRL